MAIKAKYSYSDNTPYPPARPMGSKGTSAPTYGHRSMPVENQGLLARMDAEKDNMGDEEYGEMLRSAAAHPASHMHEPGVSAESYNWAASEPDRDDRRIDSGNFPSDKEGW